MKKHLRAKKQKRENVRQKVREFNLNLVCQDGRVLSLFRVLTSSISVTRAYAEEEESEALREVLLLSAQEGEKFLRSGEGGMRRHNTILFTLSTSTKNYWGTYNSL